MNNSLKIGFRVDANNIIGTGHLAEIITLISGLDNAINIEPLVICINNFFIADKLSEVNVKHIKYLPEGMSEGEESKKIIDILKEEKCRHLIIDLLNRSNEYYGSLNENLESTCVILDGHEHKEIPATIVVNYSITQHFDFYKSASRYGTKYLIGAEYFPIDKAFQPLKPIKIKEKVERVFINQGGSDPYGFTAKIIRAIQKERLSQEVNVVIGGALKEAHKAELDEIKKSLKGDFNFYLSISHNELCRILQKTDFAVSAAGNILYELAFMGIPSLVICHHEKHNEVAKAFEEKGAVINAGIGKDLSESQIAKEIKKYINDYTARKAISLSARGIFKDCRGVPLADELVNLYNSKRF